MYNELYALMIPHMTKKDAQFCAATLALMPPEKALAMVEKVISEKEAV
mgnify:CR=1 FL=1